MKILSHEKVKRHYLVTLRLTDKDIEILEALAYEEWNEGDDVDKYTKKLFHEFQKLWVAYVK